MKNLLSNLLLKVKRQRELILNASCPHGAINESYKMVWILICDMGQTPVEEN